MAEPQARGDEPQEDGGESSGSAPQARGRGKIPFYFNLNFPNKPNNVHFWAIMLPLVALSIALWWWNPLGFRRYIPFGVTIIGAITVLVMVGFIFRGFYTCKGNMANGFIAGALSIWLLDLIPQDWLTFLWLSRLGPSYAGFEFPLPGGVWKITLLSVIFSSTTFILLYANMVSNIIRKEYLGFGLMFVLIIVLNYLIKIFFPNYANLNFIAPVDKTFYVFLVIGLIIAGGIIWKMDKRKRDIVFTEFLCSLYMILVYSFFWLNNGWQGNIRALIHAAFILSFGFAYIKTNNKDTNAWRIITPTLLIIDFFGYGLLWNSGILVLRFIPPLVILVIIYCYEKEVEEGRKNYTYPVAAMILLMTFILLMTVDNVVGFEGGTLPFIARKGTDYKDLYGQFTDRLRGFIDDRLEIATAGLYRGAVERNRYESLGVYFANVRAADPKFYTDEPIIIWGAIRSKTYKDAVMINFNCYRVRDGNRILADRMLPDKTFSIFTLEEADTECVFNPKAKEKEKIEPGPNTLTLSAEYNFGTDAYLKTYFIDRERFRAYARNNIEPLAESGIKDRKPITIFTNGPVEIGMSTGQPLVTISEGSASAVKPSIGITLTNRQEIQDKDKRVITRWDGKIKNIKELVLLVPPGIELPDIDTCAKPESDEERLKCPCSMPFKVYKKENCDSSCHGNVLEPCNHVCNEDFKGPKDETNLKNCKEECQNSAYDCSIECDLLFEPDEGAGSLGEKYKGYELDVGSLKFRDLNKDIDKHRSFQCRFEAPDEGKLLDKTPITTRYFRVRARYNYLLENSVIVNVEEPPKGTINAVPEQLFKSSIDSIEFNRELQFQGFTPDVIAGIAYVESGFRHCCKDVQSKGAKCVSSGEKNCDFDKLITSGSSYGIMQIKYNTDESKKFVDGLVKYYCHAGEKINHYDCNVKVGAAILKSKYDLFYAGCKATSEYKSGNTKKYKTLIKACDNGKSDRQPYKRYSDYIDLEAAIRGYNGYGYDPRFDYGYVEKVLEASKKIQNGIIIDNSIRELFSSKQEEQYKNIDELSGDDAPTTSPPATHTPPDTTYPDITSWEPTKAVQNQEIAVKIQGRNFQKGTVALTYPDIGENALEFISETELRFKNPFKFSSQETYYIWVRNPDGKESKTVTIEVSPSKDTTIPYAQAYYSTESKAAIISWNKAMARDNSYEVWRYSLDELDKPGIEICSISADSRDEYTCKDANKFTSGTKYKYTIITFVGAAEYSQRNAEVTVPGT